MNQRRDAHTLNQLFEKWRSGDKEAYDQIFSLLYEDLRQIAHRLFLRERDSHTMQTDDLVNKLYLKLLGSKTVPWEDYTHFLCTVARTMRQILITHARSFNRRGDGVGKVPLENCELAAGLNHEDMEVRLLALEEALGQLKKMDEALARVADLKLSLGFTLEEIAQKLNLGVSGVKREWLFAKKFLGKTVWGMAD